MARLGRWCVGICYYLLLSFFALIFAISILELFNPGLQTEEKSFGSEEQRFYLLLLDEAYGHIAGGYDRRFRYGMSPEERESFAHLLRTIRYKSDCTLGRSIAVDGGISCVVEGELVDFIDHGGH